MADEGDDWNDRVFVAGMWSHSYVRRIYRYGDFFKGRICPEGHGRPCHKPRRQIYSVKEIVQKEELSQKYLESIMRMLSKANLIEAASGHGGGYRLKRLLRNIHCGRYLNSRKAGLPRWHV